MPVQRTSKMASPRPSRRFLSAVMSSFLLLPPRRLRLTPHDSKDGSTVRNRIFAELSRKRTEGRWRSTKLLYCLSDLRQERGPCTCPVKRTKVGSCLEMRRTRGALIREGRGLYRRRIEDSTCIE